MTVRHLSVVVAVVANDRTCGTCWFRQENENVVRCELFNAMLAIDDELECLRTAACIAAEKKS